jgi:hypothetical protein
VKGKCEPQENPRRKRGYTLPERSFDNIEEDPAMNTTPANTHEGKVVGVAGDKLTTTCNKGHEHCHTMAKDAKVTCDGKASKAADLKAGTCVRVTEKNDDKTVATAVESGKHITEPVAKA